jgi:hypothetical protein
MARRELRVVATEQKLGAVAIVDGKAVFEEKAQTTFAGLRRRFDDDVKLARLLLKDGWSNGYLYLSEAEE